MTATNVLQVSIIGLGNVFLGDDGIGPLVIEHFRCRYECDDNVDVLDLGTPGLDLAPYLYGRHLIILVDAVQSNAPAGTIAVYCEEDFASQRATLRITGHDPGLWDALAHLRLADQSPAELIIIGIVPQACNFGEAMSGAVLDTVDAAVHHITHVLSSRGLRCTARVVPEQEKLWWFPLSTTRPAKTLEDDHA